MKSSLAISRCLKDACQWLELPEHQQLIKDVELVCQQLVSSRFRVAVLAPFNYGKSTLINALLGKEIMPTKILRTTGTVISIKYGTSIKTVITLNSGEIIKSNDTEILKEFAVLNRKGKRREDVVSVEVSYPHKLLQMGVELFDLPGTNDAEQQDTLVRDQLLQVDLVMQILNVEQPFSLGEENTLKNWLINRGIHTVIFIINKMNLKSKEEQKEIFDDVYLTVQDFYQKYQFDLPEGLKNLYRVDALPALKAKQEKNISKIITSGIVNFEALLLTIISIQKKKVNQARLLRVINRANQVSSILQEKSQILNREIKDDENIRNSIIRKGKEKEKYFKEEFKIKIQIYRNWLSNSLIANYELNAAESLEKNQFSNWQDTVFQPAIITYLQSIQGLVTQICQEFQQIIPENMTYILPSYPYVNLPERGKRNAGQWFGDIFNGGANRKRLDSEYERKKWQSYKNGANKYLSEFRDSALKYIREYDQKVEPLITFPIPPESLITIRKREQLKVLKSQLSEIKDIASLTNNFARIKNKLLEKIQVFIFFSKNWLFCFFKQWFKSR